jgi:hypothetical protein
MRDWKDTTLIHHQSVIVHSVFVRPGDQNYLLARWTLAQGLYPEFFWQALQCLEKYMKAALVLNKRRILGFRHDLGRLWRCVAATFPMTLDQEFSKPSKLADDFWTEGTIEGFISRIHAQGSADSRYGLVSWARQTDDLFKLDQIAYRLRQLTVGMDWVIGLDFPSSGPNKKWSGNTCKDALEACPNLMIRGEMRELDRLANNMGATLHDIIHSWNFEFRRADADIKWPAPKTIAPGMGPFENSHLFLCWQALNSGNTLPNNFLEAMRWTAEHIPMPPGDQRLIKSKLAKF